VIRQIGDTLVWLGVILAVAAVIYFTPRFASYVKSKGPDRARGSSAWQEMVYRQDLATDDNP
jgi:hypothetical protein